MIVKVGTKATQIQYVSSGDTVFNEGTTAAYVDTSIGSVLAAPVSSAVLVPPGSSVPWTGPPGMLYGTDPTGGSPGIGVSSKGGVLGSATASQIASSLLASGLAQQVASFIATGTANGLPGGTPLLHGMDFLGGGPNQTVTIPANSSVSKTFPFSKPGYVINLNTVTTNVSTVPFLQVDLLWQDVNSQVTLDYQSWITTCVQSGTYLHRGTGPVRGPLLTVTFINLDPTESMTCTYSIIESTQHTARDDWRAPVGPKAGFGVVPSNGFTAGTGWTFLQNNTGDPSMGVMFSVPNANGNSIPAHTNFAFLLPLYCGDVYLSGLQPIGVNLSWSLFVPPTLPATYGGATGGNSPCQPLQTGALVAFSSILPFPRFPLVLVVNNNNAASELFTGMCTFREYAS